jgi:hypothetical protein
VSSAPALDVLTVQTLIQECLLLHHPFAHVAKDKKHTSQEGPVLTESYVKNGLEHPFPVLRRSRQSERPASSRNPASAVTSLGIDSQWPEVRSTIDSYWMEHLGDDRIVS